MGSIYKITNKINGYGYIGQTIRPVKARWDEHIGNELNNGSLFHQALMDYGIDNFNFEIIEDNLDNKDLNKREQYWIKYYNTYIYNDNAKGYNMTPGGTGGRISTKLSINQAKEIQKLLKETELSETDIGKQYGINRSGISGINLGMYWYDSTIEYPIRKVHKNYQSISRELYNEIVNLLLLNTMTLTEIGDKYGLNATHITSINQGKYCYNGQGYYQDIYSGPFPIRKENQLTDLTNINQIIYDILFSNDSMEKIGAKYGIKGNTLTYIALGKRQKEYTKLYKLPLRKYKLENQKIYNEINNKE